MCYFIVQSWWQMCHYCEEKSLVRKITEFHKKCTVRSMLQLHRKHSSLSLRCLDSVKLPFFAIDIGLSLKRSLLSVINHHWCNIQRLIGKNAKCFGNTLVRRVMNCQALVQISYTLSAQITLVYNSTISAPQHKNIVIRQKLICSKPFDIQYHRAELIDLPNMSYLCCWLEETLVCIRRK